MFSDFSCALYFWVKSHENKRCRSYYSTKHAGLSSFLMASISVAIQNLLDLRPVWHSILVGDNVHAFRRRSGTSLTMSEVFQNDVVLLVFRLFSTFDPYTVKAFTFWKVQKFPNWNAHVFCNISCVFWCLLKVLGAKNVFFHNTLIFNGFRTEILLYALVREAK